MDPFFLVCHIGGEEFPYIPGEEFFIQKFGRFMLQSFHMAFFFIKYLKLSEIYSLST